MDWVNVLSIPGVTYQIEYRKFGAGTWGTNAYGNPVTVVGEQFVANTVSMFSNWANFRVFVQIPGVSAPVALRSHVVSTESSAYGDYVYSKGDSTLPDPGRFYFTGVADGYSNGVLLDDSLPYLLYEGGYDSGYLTATFTIERSEIVPFWTGFVYASADA